MCDEEDEFLLRKARTYKGKSLDPLRFLYREKEYFGRRIQKLHWQKIKQKKQLACLPERPFWNWPPGLECSEEDCRDFYFSDEFFKVGMEIKKESCDWIPKNRTRNIHKRKPLAAMRVLQSTFGGEG